MARAREDAAADAAEAGFRAGADTNRAREADAPVTAAPHPDSRDWMSAAGRPAFEELRNVMLLLGLRVSGVRRALVEIGAPMQEYLQPDDGRDLSHVGGAMEDLTEAVGEIENGLEVLRTTLQTLEDLVMSPRRSTKLAELVRLADSLAQHHTRPVGGVRWHLPETDPTLALPRTVAIAVIGTALSLLSLRLAATAPGNPIDVACESGDHVCALSFESALHVADTEGCARALAQMFGDDAPVAITVRGSALVLVLPLAPQRGFER
ncbi:MAG TPA: hypothetical protein VG755_42325 [Nannocystaceae bacterium]|nr:hypothetical protein [Nannocystaceae bacterium]